MLKFILAGIRLHTIIVHKSNRKLTVQSMYCIFQDGENKMWSTLVFNFLFISGFIFSVCELLWKNLISILFLWRGCEGLYCLNVAGCYLLFPHNVTVNKYSCSNLFKIFSSWGSSPGIFNISLRQIPSGPVNKLCKIK